MSHGEIVAFPWGVADLIRDTFKRGKYQDVILPLTVLRRLDTIGKLDEAGLLFKVLERFKAVDLHPDRIDNPAMGTMFEELIRRSNEAPWWTSCWTQTGLSFPAVAAGMGVLARLGIGRELTGRKRDRVFAYQRYLSILQEGTEPP